MSSLGETKEEGKNEASDQEGSLPIRAGREREWDCIRGQKKRIKRIEGRRCVEENHNLRRRQGKEDLG